MIDLYAGLGGWAEGALAEGYYVVGFDIERHQYGSHKYPGQLIIQDVRTIHGSQFRDATLIVASPPCQAYSYRAMPWKRAKALPPPDNTLFDACFRIQREACEAAGRHIPLIVENVRGAQPWVGRARWRHGSFFLWGDVPALMPIVLGDRPKFIMDDIKNGQRREVEGLYEDGAVKNAGGSWFAVSHNNVPHTRGDAVKNGNDWFGSGDDCSLQRRYGSKSSKRKAASALIAKIPAPLARHIAKTFYPSELRQ